jgi:hypothetical protein
MRRRIAGREGAALPRTGDRVRRIEQRGTWVISNG